MKAKLALANAWRGCGDRDTISPTYYLNTENNLAVFENSKIQNMASNHLAWSMNDSYVYMYQFFKDGKPIWIAWYEPPGLVLPDDSVPSKTVQIPVNISTAVIETIITRPVQTQPDSLTVQVTGGMVTTTLDSTPEIVVASG